MRKLLTTLFCIAIILSVYYSTYIQNAYARQGDHVKTIHGCGQIHYFYDRAVDVCWAERSTARRGFAFSVPCNKLEKAYGKFKARE